MLSPYPLNLAGGKTTIGRALLSAKALALLDLKTQINKPILCVEPDLATLYKTTAQLKFFAPKAAIFAFPNYDALPFDRANASPKTIALRLQTLTALTVDANAIVITTPLALLGRIVSRSWLTNNTKVLRLGDAQDLNQLAHHLGGIGYKRVAMVTAPSEFTIKGSILDIFPIACENPFRIDFFDKNIDSIRTFSPTSQHTLEKVSECRIIPAQEFSITNEGQQYLATNLQNLNQLGFSWLAKEFNKETLPLGIEFFIPLLHDRTETLFDYLPRQTLISTEDGNNFSAEFEYLETRHEQAKSDSEQPPAPLEHIYITPDEYQSSVDQHPQLTFKKGTAKGAGSHNLDASLLPPITIDSGHQKPLDKLCLALEKFQGKTLIVCHTQTRFDLLLSLLQERGLAVTTVSSWQEFNQNTLELAITQGELPEGLANNRTWVLTEKEIFGTSKTGANTKPKTPGGQIAPEALDTITIGAPIVHELYGVGRFQGIHARCIDGIQQDFLLIIYADKAKLFVPMHSLNFVTRYFGGKPDFAPLHKLGTGQWKKARKKAAEAVCDVAAELLSAHAERMAKKGFAAKAPTEAFNAFMASFPYTDTEGQITATAEVLHDMQANTPMDRLICADVGFGKTEIAMRAAFLAVESNRQVAFLCPTTLLVEQHTQTFYERLHSFAFNVAGISRFTDKKTLETIHTNIENGTLDIIIGTHKLLQGTFNFKNLGLVIVDEEHRFGVRQKEQFKRLRTQVDFLAMTATPIPRTLNMSLGGLKNLSLVTTPPPNRNPIHTVVSRWDNNIVKQAIEREISRGGQVFIVHNNIKSIDELATRIKTLVPEASTHVANGKMHAKTLQKIMHEFYLGTCQILISTTIIENGIDVTNANTIIINNAQNYGLAQLHQLRGRVGRSSSQAYAYLLYEGRPHLSGDAKKRLDAIESLEELGAGFVLANHDLEIRGAGDMLGDKQSGKVSEIGFHLYQRLLKQAIESLEENKLFDVEAPTSPDIKIDMGLPNFIPESFVFDVNQRLVFYHRLSFCKNNQEILHLEETLKDQYGTIPDAAKNLFFVARIKLICTRIGVKKINCDDQVMLLDFSATTTVSTSKIIELIQNQAHTYQLKNNTRLIIKKSTEQNESRLIQLEKELKMLEKN